MKRTRWFFPLVSSAGALLAGNPTAAELLERCIAYHDPSGVWPKLAATLELAETRPDGTVRRLHVTLDLPAERFVYAMTDDEHQLIKKLEGDECHAELNGSTEITEELAKKYRTDCDQIKRYRNYYLYLYGLPMKLKDPGTQLQGKVLRTTFQERAALALVVTYEPDVGKDTWYFYLHPATYALLGCRFFHDESKNDGEYIVFEGEYQLGELRLPQTRRWYVNKDGRFLGMDALKGHVFVGR